MYVMSDLLSGESHFIIGIIWLFTNLWREWGHQEIQWVAESLLVFLLIVPRLIHETVLAHSAIHSVFIDTTSARDRARVSADVNASLFHARFYRAHSSPALGRLNRCSGSDDYCVWDCVRVHARRLPNLNSLFSLFHRVKKSQLLFDRVRTPLKPKDFKVLATWG